jgi:hypothetical protein
MKDAKNQNRKIYVFVGENASCGTPHPVTGRMSTYGQIYRVDGTLRQAREWADYMDRYNTGGIIAVGGRGKMREYCRGSFVHHFNDDLEYAPTVYPDDNENAENWRIEQ